MVWNGDQNQINEFLYHIDNIKSTIKLTVEKKENGCLPFLSGLVERVENRQKNLQSLENPPMQDSTSLDNQTIPHLLKKELFTHSSKESLNYAGTKNIRTKKANISTMTCHRADTKRHLFRGSAKYQNFNPKQEKITQLQILTIN